jgi:hypothetical protein
MGVSLAYELHIIRRLEDGKTSPITLDEWQAAESVVPGIRMATGDVEVRNPATGQYFECPIEVVTLKSKSGVNGDARCIGAAGRFRCVLRFMKRTPSATSSKV